MVMLHHVLPDVSAPIYEDRIPKKLAKKHSSSPIEKWHVDRVYHRICEPLF